MKHIKEYTEIINKLNSLENELYEINRLESLLYVNLIRYESPLKLLKKETVRAQIDILKWILNVELEE